ncbi:hypothetical protein GQ464_015810 [Rhodocaloribacter litoris]|uniref:hypothetical protein n=1 Tax=Rhodocaloribacter litoris TaxID=2558931 RepID=UPI001421CBC2|nr:hypothetical protein [Rhodocaloribacter litoris]QXD14864.1 hypothetical protein GQ464_015810 [Rhodocaloribacter litoris]GIV59037.1 MAG: hypothetical protein KatS3mg043_0126 [Rhodothermaceae bacterium]
MSCRPAVLWFLLPLVLGGCGRQFTALQEDPLLDVVRIGETFVLAQGEETGIEGTGLRLRFLLVTEDSRCPRNVNCPTAGSASILLRTLDEEERPVQFILSIPGLVPVPYLQNTVVQHRALRFQLVQLDPYPEHNRPPITQEEYRAYLIVEP